MSEMDGWKGIEVVRLCIIVLPVPDMIIVYIV